MGGNWGWIPSDDRNRSPRYLLALLAACLVVGVVLVVVTGRLGDIGRGDVDATVIVILGLLLAGVVTLVRRLL